MTLRAGPPPQDPGAAGADQQPARARSLTFTGVLVQVSDQPAIEVAPPLRGKGWVVGNGCCDAITAHRGATLSINGTVRVAQRFAIDFVQLDLSGRLYGGDPAQNASFPFFGAEVHSAADGTVVGAQDGRPEQVPGALPTGQTVQTADGNYVVVDLGRGRFALYAHPQPGSLRVPVGDRVRTGDVLGLLGNTGNTDGPHLRPGGRHAPGRTARPPAALEPAGPRPRHGVAMMRCRSSARPLPMQGLARAASTARPPTGPRTSIAR
jgi:Peptidase family M23